MTRAVVIIRSGRDREKIATWARNVEFGTVVEFKKARRNVDQNSKLWAMLTDISEQIIWHGVKLTPEDFKDMFTASLRRARVVPGIDPGSFVPLGMRTSDMSKEELSNLLDLIAAFGAERGVIFREPVNAEK